MTSRRLSHSQRIQQVTSVKPLAAGEVGEAVEILQESLLDLGFPLPLSTRKTGLPDGIYGAETTAAVKAFQRQQHLAVDGMAGPVTLGRLDALIAARESAAAAKLRAELNGPPETRKYSGS